MAELVQKCAFFPSPEDIRASVEQGNNVHDEYGNTPLHKLAQWNLTTNIYQCFLALGDDLLVDTLNTEHQTPLHVSALNDRKGTALFLVSLGAHIDLKDNEGKAPYDLADTELKEYFKLAATDPPSAFRAWATKEFFKLSRDYSLWNERLDQLMFLVEQGADVNYQNAEGHCAVMFLVKWELKGLVLFLTLLKKKGADFTLEDKKGYTPLLIAVKNKNFKMFEFLTAELEVDPRTPNKNGVTPLSLAQDMKLTLFADFTAEGPPKAPGTPP